MKKYVGIVAGFVLLSMDASAQDVPANEVTSPSQSNSRFNKYARVMPISKMDQRKIYQWGNGQRSTPTGRLSGTRNVHYAKVMGDSAVVVYQPPITTKKTGSRDIFKNAAIIPIIKMDQRKIYNWKNGQRATPTGRRSGTRHINNAKVVRDSAVAVYDWEVKNYR